MLIIIILCVYVLHLNKQFCILLESAESFSVYVKNWLPAFLAPDHDLATTQASFPFPLYVQEDRLQGHEVTACLAKRDIVWWDMARHSGYDRNRGHW